MGMDDRRAIPLVLPLWVTLGVFFILPLVIVLVISFGRRGVYGGVAGIEDFWGYLGSGQFLANYRRSFDWLYAQIFWRSRAELVFAADSVAAPSLQGPRSRQ